MNIINNIKLIYLFPSILFCLIVPSLVSGPFLPDLFLSIIALFGIVYIFIDKDYKIFKHPFVLVFLFFYFYINIRSLLSDNIFNSLHSSLFYFRYLFFFIAASKILLKYPLVSNFFLYTCITTFIVVMIDALFQFFVGTNILGFEKHGNRLSGLFRDEFILGSYLSRLFPLLVGLIIYHHKLKSNLFIFFYLILFISIDVLVYFSGERTAFFYILLSSIIMIVFLNKYRFVRITSVLFSFLLIFFYGHFNSIMNDRMINQTITDFGIDVEAGNLDQVLSGINFLSEKHEAMILSSIKMFKANIFFGQGPNSFEILCNNDNFSVVNSCSNHPHNNYIQMLAEVGIIGTLPIFVIFMYIVYILIKHFIDKFFFRKIFLEDHSICFYTCCFISLFPLIPSSSFYNNWLSVIFYLPVCFIFKDVKNKKDYTKK